jgi:hypothetical protein
MDESVSCMGRWLKTMMNQVIALLEKGTEFIEKISNMSFAFMATEVDGKILLQEFGGSAGPEFFKRSSIFSCFPN